MSTDTRDDHEVWEAMREGADVAAIMRLLRRDLPGVAEHLDGRVAELRAEMEAHRKPGPPAGEIQQAPSTADLQSLSRRLAPGDPVGSLAADLCETTICEAMPPEEIVWTARACREAAEICYGRQATGKDTRPLTLRDLGRGIDPNGFDPEAPAILDEIRRAQQMSPEEFRREYEQAPDRGFIDPGVEGEPWPRLGTPRPPTEAEVAYGQTLQTPPVVVEGAQAILEDAPRRDGLLGLDGQSAWLGRMGYGQDEGEDDSAFRGGDR